ncbi:MAG: prepilin-type N-terminal cleavage/methylation domain-containing protein [Opitutales bacterium]|nr:prepilin-type N-terminal cleavage/methylation domain-containing protein [Opitutales bacterium]
MKSAHTKTKGFTLVEIIIVLAIIGILTSMAFPLGQHIRNRSTQVSKQADAVRFQTAIYDFAIHYHHYPPTLPKDTWFNLAQEFDRFINDFSGKKTTSINPEGVAFCSFTPEEYREKSIKPLWLFIQGKKTRAEAVQELKAKFTTADKVEGTTILFYSPK